MTNESMKKVFATKLTDTSLIDLEGIGVLRFEGARIYKYVTYNAGGDVIAAVAGNCVVYHGDDAVVVDSAADVTSDYSSGAGIVAGVLQAVIASGSFGWIQIKGIAVLNLALDTGADGNELIVGTTDGALAVRALATSHTAGVAVDATAKIVLLDCPW
ncbi:hypothetical protein LCGC14_1887580 [marine sediment metagenome]|uniref:Uncharacterized protein n=1 Tax=marine sediment metagenome TaxID=412755 RepID=A0A0F9GNP6_9ZZZZ